MSAYSARQDPKTHKLDVFENSFHYISEHDAFFHSDTNFWYVIEHKLGWSSEENRWYSYDDKNVVWRNAVAPRRMAPGPWNATNRFKWGFINGKWYDGLIKHERVSDGASLFYPESDQKPPVKSVWLLKSSIKSERPQKHIATIPEPIIDKHRYSYTIQDETCLLRDSESQSKRKLSKEELQDLYEQLLLEPKAPMKVQKPASKLQTLHEQIEKQKMEDIWNNENIKTDMETYRSDALQKNDWKNLGTAISLQTDIFCDRLDSVFLQVKKFRDSLYSSVGEEIKKQNQTDSDDSHDVSNECDLDSADSSQELQDKPESWNPAFHESGKVDDSKTQEMKEDASKKDSKREEVDAFSESEDENEMSISERLKLRKRVLEIDLTSASGREKRITKTIDVSGRRHARALRRLGTGRAPQYPNKPYPKPSKPENAKDGFYFCPHCNFESFYPGDACNHSDNCRNCGERYCLRIDCKNRSFKDKRRMKNGYHKKCGMFRDGPVEIPRKAD